jgi:hypothetical protein
MGGISQLMNLQEGQQVANIPGGTSYQRPAGQTFEVDAEEFEED